MALGNDVLLADRETVGGLRWAIENGMHVVNLRLSTSQEEFFGLFHEPPVEFGAPGIDVTVAWLNKSTIVSTGNSFAAPHMAGIAALIRGRHPDLTPLQVKTVLFACATNARNTKSRRAGKRSDKVKPPTSNSSPQGTVA